MVEEATEEDIEPNLGRAKHKKPHYSMLDIKNKKDWLLSKREF